MAIRRARRLAGAKKRRRQTAEDVIETEATPVVAEEVTESLSKEPIKVPSFQKQKATQKKKTSASSKSSTKKKA